MSFRTTLFAGVITALSAATAFAGEIELHDAYARASSPNAKAGAAFMTVQNRTAIDDRLIGASSPVAKKVELHTHIEDANGVMKMVHVEEGFDLPANSEIIMKRGGDHVMFMGLTESFEQGKKIPLTLVFEKAGEVTYEVEVDLEREDGHGMGHSHGSGS
jgi:copper(I)-binding protein